MSELLNPAPCAYRPYFASVVCLSQESKVRALYGAPCITVYEILILALCSASFSINACVRFCALRNLTEKNAPTVTTVRALILYRNGLSVSRMCLVLLLIVLISTNLYLFFHICIKERKAPQTGLIDQSAGLILELLIRFERTTSSLPRKCSAD